MLAVEDDLAKKLARLDLIDTKTPGPSELGPETASWCWYSAYDYENRVDAAKRSKRQLRKYLLWHFLFR